MESKLFKNPSGLHKNETNGKLIVLPGVSNNESIIIEEIDKVIIQVPKGYALKSYQIEKKEDNTSIPELRIPLRETRINRNLTEKVYNDITSPVDYGIINLHKDTLPIIDEEKYYKIYEEGLKMGKLALNNVIKEQLSFLMTAIFLIIASIVGIIVFNRIGFYIIHPLLYIITLIMGIGWGSTALMSIKNNKV